MTVISLALAALATARLTRMVTTDRIFLAPRVRLLRALVRRHGEDGLMPYLVTCDWCVSIYTGTSVAAAWVAWGDTRAFLAVAAALAFSYVAGYLAERTVA